MNATAEQLSRALALRTKLQKLEKEIEEQETEILELEDVIIDKISKLKDLEPQASQLVEDIRDIIGAKCDCFALDIECPHKENKHGKKRRRTKVRSS